MKKILLFLTLGLCIISIHAQPTLEVRSGNIIINGTTITRPWTFAEFTSDKTLGKYDREDLGGANDIYTYDKTGIMLYCTSSKKRISAFNVYLGKDKDETQSFNPKGLYKGKIIVEGFAITSKTSITKVRQVLPQYNFEMSLIEAYRGEYMGLYVYLKYDPAGKKVLWSSIGRND